MSDDINKMTDEQLAERLNEHTCQGAIFCGAPAEVARAECPACTDVELLCDWEHITRDFDGTMIGIPCGAVATHRLLIEYDAIEPTSTLFVCDEHRDAVIEDMRECSDARVLDDSLMTE